MIRVPRETCAHPWSTMPCSPPMMLVSMVGQAIFDRRAYRPSMMHRSYRPCCRGLRGWCRISRNGRSGQRVLVVGQRRGVGLGGVALVGHRCVYMHVLSPAQPAPRAGTVGCGTLRRYSSRASPRATRHPSPARSPPLHGAAGWLQAVCFPSSTGGRGTSCAVRVRARQAAA